MTRCIYCNTTENLSVSDIIPDGLTNAKITNRNVCRIPHNNKFSDQFESYVINCLSPLRDKLDIKTKGNKYPETEFEVKIGGFSATKKGTKNSALIGNKVLSDDKKNIKFGPLDVIEKIAQKNGYSTIKKLDVNNMEIETKFKIELEAFFSEKTKKLMAKIAYEWYCRHNEIDGFYSEFENITNYICEENTSVEELVTYIKAPEVYSSVDKSCQSGSHMLFTYVDSSNAVNVVISFFGICIYNVKVLERFSSKFKYNCLYQEFQVNSNQITLKKQSIGELFKFIMDNTESIIIGGISARRAKDMSNAKIWEGVWHSYVLNQLLSKEVYLYPNYDNELIKLVLNRYVRLFNEGLIHIRGLKRFVTDIFGDGYKEIKLNPKVGDPSKTWMYYVVFLLGSQEEQVDIKLVNRLVKEKFGLLDNELRLDNKRNEQMLKQIIETEGYCELLNKGADKIRNASFD
ncbi:hypothetical protein C3496_10470 [Bacillus anthracis]|uniref:hypothetical protein n=1 Tax=Bacillus TaxID=1386 RepID=UPI0010A5DF9D|nr:MULTISPECIES: hypothetical protein [Bacillus]QBJ66775.1 hypothetical protein C3496_10470 [Bacillus anthracis]THG62947.1 hypothetical protein E7Y01_04155 [Bacillus sp. HUB-I-004]